MLTDKRCATVVSSLGWVDGDGLWVLETSGGPPRRIPLGEARHASLHAGTDDHFSVVHHTAAERVRITVHRFEEPGVALAEATLRPGDSELRGDASAWARVQTHYVTYYKGPYWSAFCLVRIRPRVGRVEVDQLDWYDDRYDKAYQGLVGVTEVPDSRWLLVAVQRNSCPVLYDPDTRTELGTVDLADRGGNPRLEFHGRGAVLWADDYDTILRLDWSTREVVRSRRLQGDDPRVMQFVGAYWIDPSERLCVVPRPFSGDVLVLSADDLRTVGVCRTGGQPLEAVLTPDGEVVARVWQTGELLRRTLENPGPDTSGAS